MLHEQCQQQIQIGMRRRAQAVVALLVVLLQTHLLETTGNCADPVDIRTRRTFVPAKHPELWPKGDWVPIRPQKLDALLNATAVSSGKPDRFAFASAVYEATFNPQAAQLVQGTASLVLQRSEARVRLFEPCNLALTDSRWVGGDVEKRAILGTGLDGVKRLVTREDSHNLAFNWILGGRKRLTGYDFEIAVPKAVVTTLHLSAPAGWLVTSDTGAVQRAVSGIRTGDGDRGSPSSAAWQIELGQSERCRIRIQESATDSPGLGMAVSYQLSSRLQLRSEIVDQFFEFTFNSLPSEQDEFTVAIPPDLIVSSVEDDQGRAFSWRDTGIQSDGWHVLRIQKPGVSEDDSTKVIIVGRQSVPTPEAGTVRIKVEPPRPADAVLLGGNASPVSVVVESPYQLATYSAGGLRQTATSVDADRHELAFEQYASRAYVDLQIQNSGRQSSQKLSVREYSLLNVGTTPQELDILLELTAQAPGLFESTWLVPSEWEVTAISLVTQSGMVDSVTESLSWNVSRSAGEHQRLVIDLADALPVRKPLVVRVVGQRADRSRESEIQVPVILPEIARSVALAFGVLGCEEPHEVQIGSEIFQRHADVSIFAETAWSDLISQFGEIPQAAWTADYSTRSDEISSATLLLPGSVLDDVGESSISTGNLDTEVLLPLEGADEKEEGGISASKPFSEKPRLAETETQFDPRSTGRREIVSTEFESRLSPSSVSRDLHRFTWRFHYSSESSPFRFSLPESAELLAVTWRGQKIAPVQEKDEWFIPLTFVNAGDRLSVEYTMPSQNVYLRETYRCRIPVADVTVVQFDWRVQLRHRYSIVAFASELTPDEEPRSGNWLSWCFGPLARNESSKIFSPIGFESWSRLFRGREKSAKGKPATAGDEWHTYSASVAGLPESLAVHVCDHSRLNALSWFVLILSSLVGVVLRAATVPHRSRFALVWLSGCVASIALVPGAYAELVGAAALGSILATLLPRSFVRPVRVKARDEAQMGMASTITRRVVAGSIILSGVGLVGSAVAQKVEPEQSEVIDVLVPYQNSPFQKEIDSPYVYIRNTDHQKLSKDSTANDEERPRLLMTNSYWTVNVSETGRAEVAASIRVALHDDDANEVEIPVPARFLSGQADCSVNGASVSVLPSADGSRLRVPLPHVLHEATKVEPGNSPVPPPVAEPLDVWREFAITLVLRPLTQRSTELSRISLPVPAIPDSRVALSFHEEPEAVQVGDSSKARRLSSQEAAEFVLGSEDDLTISWRRSVTVDPSTTPDPSRHPSVEIRSSIEVHPNWMDRRTYAKYLVAGQEVRQVEWKLPASCQIDLSQFRSRNLVDKALRSEAGEVILSCEFDPPLTESFGFEFRWRQLRPETAGTSGTDWAVPIVPGSAATSLKLTSHLTGLTPEAGFQFLPELQSLAESSEVGSDEFVELWPEGGRPRIPLIVVEIAEGTEINSEIVPSRSQRTTRVSQVGSISFNEIRWTVSAEIDTAVVPAFIHEFLLADDFRVDSVNVLEDAVDRLSHWEHGDGKLTLHLRDRRSGVQNITITGQQKISSNGSVKVPQVKPLVGESTETTLLIYQAGQLRVAVEGAEVLGADNVVATQADDSGEFVGRFRMSPEQGANIVVEQIPIDPAAWIVADITSDEVGECYVSATIHLHAISEQNLPIELPGWTTMENLAVVPTTSVAGAIVAVADNQESINLSLPRPIPQQVEVALTARFSPKASSSFRLQPPVVSNVEKQRAVLALSQGMDDWEILPNDAPRDLQLSEVSEFDLRLVSENDAFVEWTNATKISRETLSPGFQKLPAFVLHSIRPGVRQSGVAKTNILLQADRPEVSLSWPQNLRLISVRIDGQVSDVAAPDQGVLTLSFSTRESIHDVEILWTAERNTAAMKVQRRSMSVPRVTDAGPVQAFVLAMPTRRISLISTVDSGQHASRDAVELSNKWLELVRRRSVESTSLEMLRQIAETLTLATADSTAAREPGSLANATVDLLFSGQMNSFGADSGVVVEDVDGTQVDFWVVDTHVDRILGSILIVIVAVPVFIVLLGLETGDKIAKRPEVCWLAIGLIWWLCLKASGAGFILGVLSSLWIVGSAIHRQYASATVMSKLNDA